jgi:superoxide dismutase, Fe-Mn family
MINQERMSLPPLPYEYDALAPILSAETLKYHHDKHHRGYVEQLNKLLPGSGFENAPLDAIILEAEGPLYEQAAQHWNHSFYWKSMNPEIKVISTQRALHGEIKSTFGSVSNFSSEFKKTGDALFGSGWLWLVSDSMDKLQILATKNAWNPLREELTPILVCDLWEHSYYIDYRNARSKYLSRFCEIINWDFAEKNYSAIKALHSEPRTWTPLKHAGRQAGGPSY